MWNAPEIGLMGLDPMLVNTCGNGSGGNNRCKSGSGMNNEGCEAGSKGGDDEMVAM